jgi:hypothetical protein
MLELAAALRERVRSASPRLARLSEEDVRRDRGAGKWIKKEILGHLIDSAANNQQRFVRAPAVESFVWPGYDQAAWVAVHRYGQRPWAELVQAWTAFNLQVAQAMEAVPAERLATPCTIGDQEPRTLEWWMRDYMRHLDHHLDQILP